MHMNRGFTHASDFQAPLRRDTNTKPQPAVHPKSPLRTQHLHPTRRYKDSGDQGGFELAFELVKGMSCDTILITRLIAARRD